MLQLEEADKIFVHLVFILDKLFSALPNYLGAVTEDNG